MYGPLGQALRAVVQRPSARHSSRYAFVRIRSGVKLEQFASYMCPGPALIETFTEPDSIGNV